MVNKEFLNLKLLKRISHQIIEEYNNDHKNEVIIRKKHFLNFLKQKLQNKSFNVELTDKN